MAHVDAKAMQVWQFRDELFGQRFQCCQERSVLV